MNKPTIKGSWNDIQLVCCYRHKEPVPMIIQEGPLSPFYACPKYHEENRIEGERACKNHLSLKDYMKMMEHLHNKLVNAEMNDEKINLVNYTWKDRNGTEFKVLSQNDSHSVISVYNKRAINS